jgi:hypothetical protein
MRAVAPALLALAAAACGGAAAADLGTIPPGEAAAEAALDDEILGLVPGESLAFEVRLAGVLAGEAQLSVGKPGDLDGRRAVAVSSVVRTAGAVAMIRQVKDEVTSFVDLDQLRPLRGTSDVIFGPKRYKASTLFTEHGATIEFTPDGQPTRTLRYDFGDAVVHDAHSAMAMVRTWKAEPGAKMGLWVIGGRRIWRTEVWPVGTETIGTYLGNQPALRLDGMSVRSRPDLTVEPGKKPRYFSVWLSDDADRVPLRFTARTELGEITIELVNYQRP